MSDQTTKIVLCPECSQVIDWPIKNPVGPFCPKCAGLISVVYPKTTNDPQAPYGEQPKQELTLSDEEITSMDSRHRCDYKAGEPPSFRQGAEEARDWFQAKITSGELMVVKTCKFVTNNYDANIDCDGCGWSICYIHVEDNPMKFCPGCGARIVP